MHAQVDHKKSTTIRLDDVSNCRLDASFLFISTVQHHIRSCPVERHCLWISLSLLSSRLLYLSFLTIAFSSDSCRSEATSSSFSLAELCNLHQISWCILLNDQLGHTISLFDLEVICLAQIEEQDLDLAPVVAIDDASAHIDAVPDSKAAPRSYPAV